VTLPEPPPLFVYRGAILRGCDHLRRAVDIHDAHANQYGAPRCACPTCAQIRAFLFTVGEEATE
jgi:hypothetical protein